jgi:hypothetical protein
LIGKSVLRYIVFIFVIHISPIAASETTEKVIINYETIQLSPFLASPNWFGYLIGSDSSNSGPCRVNINTGLSVTLLSAKGNDYFGGSTWANGKWYAVTVHLHNFLYCDTLTGTYTIIGNTGPIAGEPVALCWKRTTSTMYMITTSPRDLYKININTGMATFVAPITGQVDNIISACYGYQDFLYCMYRYGSGARFGLIDDSTGVITLLGALATGITPFGAQGMAYHLSHNLLYWIFYTQSGWSELCSIDRYTGIATLIGVFSISTHISSFVIPDGLTGLIKISNEIPTSFSLMQNYPNPFNPATKISFNIPKYSNVKLRIFDILGKEKAVLVNEKLNPGTYNIEWNASGVSSGVYFYELSAGDYREVKKMILVK